MASSYKTVINCFKEASENVRWHFEELPDLLIDGYSYEVSLAYLFLRTERAQNSALYCGAVKLHRANTDITSRAINAQYLSRTEFLKLYENVFAKALPNVIRDKIKFAEKIRDRVVHGKKVSDNDMRVAHVDVLEYAEAMNVEIYEVAGFQPFGNLRGFKGRARSLDEKTSRWLLKGLGFAIA
jgi:hypothetical protein